MRAVRIVAAVALAACALAPAWAHHSAAVFDFTRVLRMRGVVKEIRVINPHMSLTLVVSDRKGTREVSFEGHSVNNFYRAGWRPNLVKIGDRITVNIAPRKDGREGGYVVGFTTASGRLIGFDRTLESGPPRTAPGSARGSC
ncbi:MAG TPA: DUF6152 family protein [Steroidobacteraceae bacterium]|nr:DUF6152 family protein [Steroidobacteraceae bacterium]